ncbi:hypothetical protein E2562_025377 [Oryza meyeriana var. granulata]|uniref:DUF834 domain-containing protein n=1 Tax=Oryza meyeriana var. granulata TaxID=110450 RepID=A0A6G1DNF1_9ORYZ|nr:hypothetical protein E2562_025377 [Oryza meyeriana var. granulata]
MHREEGQRTGQPEEQAEAAVKMATMTHVGVASLAVSDERWRQSWGKAGEAAAERQQRQATAHGTVALDVDDGDDGGEGSRTLGRWRRQQRRSMALGQMYRRRRHGNRRRGTARSGEGQSPDP